MVSIVLFIYEILWRIALPALIFSPKLRDNWKERLILKERGIFDLWIHAASVGEANMAADIISDIYDYGFDILATTNTVQGKELLKKRLKKENITIRYFPFDMPSIMKKAFLKWCPRLAVLLETELWPSFIYECNKNNIPVIIINGRLSKKSFRTYVRFRSFWRKFSPDMIYAISKDDAVRYAQLFGKEKVMLMKNIKFDRISVNTIGNPSHLRGIIPEDYPFLAFGSIRKQEEKEILLAIEVMIALFPDIVIGLFPRHIQRIEWWKRSLSQKGIKFFLRSHIDKPVSSGTVIIWDMFGELQEAYSIANATFVGGSLKPCGGHNFLEPLSYGLIPCVGPFLDNFRWIDDEIFKMGIVKIVKDWKELVKELAYQLIVPVDKNEIKERFELFIRSRKGGKMQAVNLILKYLEDKNGKKDISISAY